jgi:hypothetical protein
MFVPPYVAHYHLRSLNVVHQRSSCFLLVSSSFHCSVYPNDPSFLLGNSESCRRLCGVVRIVSFTLSFSIVNIFSLSLRLTSRTSVPPYVAHYHLRSLNVVHQRSSCFLLVSSSFHCSVYLNDPSFLLGNSESCRRLCGVVRIVSFTLSFFIVNIFSLSLRLTSRTSVPPYVAHYHLPSLTVIHQHLSCFHLVSSSFLCSDYPDDPFLFGNSCRRS